MTTMTARDVLAALYHHFGGRWAMLTEVTARPPRYPSSLLGRSLAGKDERERYRVRRIDVLLLRAAASRDTGNGIERLAIEVKVSRGDFLADIRNPAKQAPWRAIAHRHAYAVPRGLVAVDEVPADSGLIVVDPREDGYRPLVEFARIAPRPAGHEPGQLPVKNLMDAFWRAGRAEALLKGLVNNTTESVHVAGDVEELRGRVAHLTRDLELANSQADRLREQRDDWRRRYAAHEPPTCSTCGQPLHPARGRRARAYGHEWEHRDEVHAALCEGLRRDVAAAAWEALNAEDRRWRHLEVVGPQPGEYAAVTR